jgi:poly-gamma-glutamate biosynthesis protein PgsC/CapC
VVEAAVGLGVIISLLFSELLGASAGGIVVPGYIAMYLHRPTMIIGTIAVSLATLILIKLISSVTLLYGKRRMVLSILIGFILGWATRNIIFINVTIYDLKMQSIGYIIPGLIANWMERQGIFRTLFTMIIAAVLVRLILIIIAGGEVMFDV